MRSGVDAATRLLADAAATRNADLTAARDTVTGARAS
jgi:hypothetical protein